MSWYYTYYLAKRDKKTGKLLPFGPFDEEGKWVPVLSKSRSFASDMHESFHRIHQSECSDNIVEKFSHGGAFGSDMWNLQSLPFDDLPSGPIIKRRYIRISDAVRIEREGDLNVDDVYDTLSLLEYRARAAAQERFGCEPPKDCEGEELTPIWEYMYYPYIDVNSKEYEAFIIRLAADMLDTWNESVYVLLSEG